MATKKKKMKNYTWLIIAAIIVIAVIVLTSGGEGGTLAKFSAAKSTTMPAPSSVQTVLNVLNKAEILGWSPGSLNLNEASCNDVCAGGKPGSTCVHALQYNSEDGLHSSPCGSKVGTDIYTQPIDVRLYCTCAKP